LNAKYRLKAAIEHSEEVAPYSTFTSAVWQVKLIESARLGFHLTADAEMQQVHLTLASESA
jgi:hypothetical protein